MICRSSRGVARFLKLGLLRLLQQLPHKQLVVGVYKTYQYEPTFPPPQVALFDETAATKSKSARNKKEKRIGSGRAPLPRIYYPR